MISSFKNENRFLSNFYLLENPIVVGDITFESNEHFYQAHKTIDLIDRCWIAGVASAITAKRAGSKRGLDGRRIQVREDWDTAKLDVMNIGLVLKFMNNYDLAVKLINTENKLLVEGNYWHDNFWGDCSCIRCRDHAGENRLGLMLMSIRKMLNTIRI